MAQKVNPIAVRMNFNRFSDSSWFSDYYYSALLHQDLNFRQYLNLIKQPNANKLGFRTAKCIIHHFPKRSLIHLFCYSPLFGKISPSEDFRGMKLAALQHQDKKTSPSACNTSDSLNVTKSQWASFGGKKREFLASSNEGLRPFVSNIASSPAGLLLANLRAFPGNFYKSINNFQGNTAEGLKKIVAKNSAYIIGAKTKNAKSKSLINLHRSLVDNWTYFFFNYFIGAQENTFFDLKQRSQNTAKFKTVLTSSSQEIPKMVLKKNRNYMSLFWPKVKVAKQQARRVEDKTALLINQTDSKILSANTSTVFNLLEGRKLYREGAQWPLSKKSIMQTNKGAKRYEDPHRHLRSSRLFLLRAFYFNFYALQYLFIRRTNNFSLRPSLSILLKRPSSLRAFDPSNILCSSSAQKSRKNEPSALSLNALMQLRTFGLFESRYEKSEQNVLYNELFHSFVATPPLANLRLEEGLPHPPMDKVLRQDPKMVLRALDHEKLVDSQCQSRSHSSKHSRKFIHTVGGLHKFTLTKSLNFYLFNIQSILSQNTNNFITLRPIKVRSFFQCASLVAQEIAYQLEQKKSFRIICRLIFQQLNDYKYIKGIRITCSGRLNGAEIAKTECRKNGETSLHVFSDKIDYARTIARTPYGILGIKVWISYV
jgi:ribosomal protein S3